MISNYEKEIEVKTSQAVAREEKIYAEIKAASEELKKHKKCLQAIRDEERAVLGYEIRCFSLFKQLGSNSKAILVGIFGAEAEKEWDSKSDLEKYNSILEKGNIYRFLDDTFIGWLSGETQPARHAKTKLDDQGRPKYPSVEEHWQTNNHLQKAWIKQYQDTLQKEKIVMQEARKIICELPVTCFESFAHLAAPLQERLLEQLGETAKATWDAASSNEEKFQIVKELRYPGSYSFLVEKHAEQLSKFFDEEGLKPIERYLDREPGYLWKNDCFKP